MIRKLVCATEAKAWPCYFCLHQLQRCGPAARAVPGRRPTWPLRPGASDTPPRFVLGLLSSPGTVPMCHRCSLLAGESLDTNFSFDQIDAMTKQILTDEDLTPSG